MARRMAPLCVSCGESLEDEPGDECEHVDDNDEPDFDDDDDDEEIVFADPTGISALRAATATNPRNLPCPTCGSPNRLTPADVALGYQCDGCADRAEWGGY